MWSLTKPDLNETLNDVDEFVSLGIIDASEAQILKKMVTDYDRQEASLTTDQLNTISDETAQNIYDHFSDTQKRRRCFFIREKLFDNAFGCPYCGISESGSLDHYMDKIDYKAMALCRLNLVPMCMKCNRPKSTLPYTNFVNPYYFAWRNIEFFLCDVNFIQSEISFSFSISSTSLNPQLVSRLNEQILVIDLSDRLDKATVLFLRDSVFLDNDTPLSLMQSLPSMIKKREKEDWLYNHWQTAVLRGLQRCINGNTDVAQRIMDAVSKRKCR